MQNSKVRYKMYKAKKNWISAGLVTTAVLAGLTLGTMKSNDVVAHADTTPSTSQTAQPADSQKTAEKSEADKTADQINKVKQEVTNVQNANEANKNVQPTTDANKAHDQDQQIVQNHKDARQAVKDAEAVQTTANNDVKDAQDAVNQAETKVNQAGSDLRDAKAVQQAAQEEADKNQNAITKADDDVNNNLKPAKDSADKAYNDQLGYQKELEDGLTGFQTDLENKKKAEAAAQKKVDDTKNAITDADTDMTKIASDKNAADKAYNDQLAYQKELEDGLNNQFVPALNAAKNAEKDAQKKVDDTKNAITGADTDMTKIASDKNAADKAYNDQLASQKALEDKLNKLSNDLNEAKKAHDKVANNADVKYVQAKNDAKPAEDAAAKADAKAAASEAKVQNLKNAAQNAVNAAQNAVNAAQTALNDAQHQVQLELSNFRHNRTHDNAVRVVNAQRAKG